MGNHRCPSTFRDDFPPRWVPQVLALIQCELPNRKRSARCLRGHYRSVLYRIFVPRRTTKYEGRATYPRFSLSRIFTFLNVAGCRRRVVYARVTLYHQFAVESAPRSQRILCIHCTLYTKKTRTGSRVTWAFVSNLASNSVAAGVYAGNPIGSRNIVVRVQA